MHALSSPWDRTDVIPLFFDHSCARTGRINAEQTVHSP
jgi:hypothetical protein